MTGYNPEDVVPNVQDPEYLATKTLKDLDNLVERVSRSISDLEDYRDKIWAEIHRREDEAAS